LGRPKRKANRSVHRGGWVRLRGRVPAGPLTDPKVLIERRRGGAWRPIRAARIGGDLHFSERLRPRRREPVILRATLPSGGHSRVVRVQVYG
jgi:hypothetical protein